MDDLPKPFPLTRFIHYGTQRRYYAFGNTPAEDFLRSVAADPATPTHPKILSLGCGDIRSCMYTLWKNFGFEGKSVTGFAGVDFVLNDCSAAVLARNVLFLYLCLRMHEDDANSHTLRNEWVASVWSIWYNHELRPEHDQVLSRALAQLLQWSETAKKWAQCRLGVMVRFSSPDTFRAVKEVWALWHEGRERVESVEAMKLARRKFQERHLENMQDAASNALNPLRFHSPYEKERIDAMIEEWVAYLKDGSAFAEDVLNPPCSRARTTVNLTLFEQADVSYTLHYELVPYWAFHHAFLYSPAEVSKMREVNEAVPHFLPVANEHFEVRKTPLLANSVQQFAMWLTATSMMMKSKNCQVSFAFDCSDAISFCQTLIQFPQQYSNSLGLSEPAQFDAIYTSNLLDHFFGGAALVFITTALLKLDGTLFTTSFQYKMTNWDNTSGQYIEKMFGFPPELFPVILGIRCIGHDGQFSSTVASQPIPPHADSIELLEPLRVSLVWKKVRSNPIIIQSLTEEMQSHLLKSCISTVEQRSTFDSFLAIVHCFVANLYNNTLSYQFWDSLCKQMAVESSLKCHLIQLQTQSLLRGFHMHITVTEADCPLCTGQPLDDYIGGYTISFNTSYVHTEVYEEQLLFVQLCNGSAVMHITSIAGSHTGQNIKLNFLLPKQCAKEFQHYKVYKTTRSNTCVAIDSVKRSLHDVDLFPPMKYSFMMHERTQTSQSISEDSSIGKIVKHSGDATGFETIVSTTDACAQALKRAKITTSVCQLKIRFEDGVPMTIEYPFPIQLKDTIKYSKSKRTITITVQRVNSCPFNEEPTIYVNASNALALPQIQYNGDMRIYYHVFLQTPKRTIDLPGPFFMKFFLHELAYKASKHKYFAIVKCTPQTLHGMIIVNSIHFDPFFQSFFLNISFCLANHPSFLEVASPLKQNHAYDIQVSDENCKILEEALAQFATLTRRISPAVAEPSAGEHFQQALIHPLYPNTQLKHVLKAINENNDQCGPTPPDKSFVDVCNRIISSEFMCSYCEKISGSIKLCPCHKAAYCNKKCQNFDWSNHQNSCTNRKKASVKPVRSLIADQSHQNEQSSQSQCEASSVEPNTAHVQRSGKCSTCNKAFVQQLKWCPCRKAAYCSIKCQLSDWPQHKDVCTYKK